MHARLFVYNCAVVIRGYDKADASTLVGARTINITCYNVWVQTIYNMLKLVSVLSVVRTAGTVTF